MLIFLELLFILAPTYVWRFAFGPLKINFLELLILAFWLAFFVSLLYKKDFQLFWNFLKTLPKNFMWPTSLFLLAAIISTFISPSRSRAIGELIAFFFQPILTFFIAAYIFRNPENKIKFSQTVFYIIALFSLYGIFQYFTRIGLPQQWWGNSNEPKRALSVFEYPNAFALFLTPLLAYSLPLLNHERFKAWFYKLFFLLGILGLVSSLSRGGWFGFLGAVIIYVFVQKSLQIKKIFYACAFAAALIIAVVPNLRYRVILPFRGEKSTVSRFSLWQTGTKMIRSNPIFGKGLDGFATDFHQYNSDPNLTPVNYPHNIFLNFWVETGILGLISFIWLTVYLIAANWTKRLSHINFGITLFLIALILHGLVDAPYFKNDLALIFWIFAALTLFKTEVLTFPTK